MGKPRIADDFPPVRAVENAQTLWYTCRKNVSQRGGARMQQAGADSRREKARPEMNKRKVSNFYTGLNAFMSFFFLGGTAFFHGFLQSMYRMILRAHMISAFSAA